MGGTIPMLSPHPEKWGDASPRPPPIDARCYEERLLLYLAANNIADDIADRRKAIFLRKVGRDIYHVLSDLCSPGG